MQPPFVHTPASLANLEAALSAERFATYVAAVGGDRSRALALYEWNGEVSASIDTPRLLAERSFGFWTSLFGHHFDRTLWVPGRYRALPHFRRVTGKPIRRPAIAQRFQYLRKLQNRIAHHEPIFTRSLADDHASLLKVASGMDPDLRAWIANVSTLPRLPAVRPQFTP